MMELESDRIARGNARYSLNNAAYNVEWDEKKHPRGDDGKFGAGGGSGKSEGKAEIKSKSIKLKQGNVQLKNPIEATYDSVWKEYKINDPRMKGRGVSGKDVTIKDGKVIGVSPSIAKYLELETVGEVQGKTVLVKQKEEKKAQEEKKIQEKAAVMGKALALSDMVRTGKITKDEFNKRMKELNDYKNACKPKKYRHMNTVYNVEFDESKHPRGDDGKFGTGGGSAKPETPDREKDLAVVNIPLSKRGNIDTKIDKYKAEQKKQKDAKDKAEFAKVKESRQKDAARGKELFEKHGQAIIDYYSKKTGKSKTDIRALMKEWAQYYPDRLEKAVAQMQPSENSCKPRRFRLMNTAYNTDFDESKHPRGADGKFGTGGTGKKTEKKEKADKTTGGAKDKEKKQGAAKVESRGDKKGQPRQPANDIKEIYRLTAASSKPFSEFVNKYAEKYGGTVISRPELKSIERVKQKLAEDPGKGYNGIVDIDAKTIVVPDLDAMDSLYGELLADNSVIRAKNRFANPTESGYRDILSNVKMPNGAIVELQVSTPEMMDAKDVCHSLYEVERELAIGIENGRATQKDFSVWDKLQKIQEKVYGAAWAASTSAASFSASSLVMTEAQYLKSVETILGSGFNDLSDKTRKHFKELLSTAYGNPSESKNLSPGDSTLKSAISLPSNSIVIHRVKNSKPPDRKIRYFRVK